MGGEVCCIENIRAVADGQEDICRGLDVYSLHGVVTSAAVVAGTVTD